MVERQVLQELYAQAVSVGASWGHMTKRNSKGDYVDRLEGHLLRLEGDDEEHDPTRVECQFAQAFRTRQSAVSRKKFFSGAAIITNESADTCRWWTIAPYAYDCLVNEQGITPPEALDKVIKWADSSRVCNPDHPVQGYGFDLEGLKWLNDVPMKSPDRTFYLRNDENDLSHVAARALGEYIAKEILMKY